MTSNDKLVSKKTINAYLERLKELQKYKFSERGDELFIEKYVVKSEQVDNLYVRAIVNEFEIYNDEPEKFGTNRSPRPTETLLASIANCLEISALLYFSFANLKIKSISVEVEGKIDKRSVLSGKNRPLPGFFDIIITWYIDTDENLKKVERVLEKVRMNCHALGTLTKNYEFPRKIILTGKNSAK